MLVKMLKIMDGPLEDKNMSQGMIKWVYASSCWT